MYSRCLKRTTIPIFNKYSLNMIVYLEYLTNIHIRTILNVYFNQKVGK